MSVAQQARESFGMRGLVKIVMLGMAVQIIVGQSLPLGDARPLNAAAQAALQLLDGAAYWGSILVGCFLVVCAFWRRLQVAGALIYAVYTGFIAMTAFRFDPYVGAVYVLHAAGAFWIAAAMRPRKET